MSRGPTLSLQPPRAGGGSGAGCAVADPLGPTTTAALLEVRRTGSLRYVRHGATTPNLAGRRCGGDLDVPLHPTGRAQAYELAAVLATLEPRIGLVICSDLRRTRETAEIVAAGLPGVRVHVEPGFAERRLGRWNLMTLEETQDWLEAGMMPPGGEAADAFVHRVAVALRDVKPLLVHRPLLVGSKGVARAIGELVGRPEPIRLGNAELAEFRLADLQCLETNWTPL